MAAIYVHMPLYDFTRLPNAVLIYAGIIQVTVLLTRLGNLIRRNVSAGKLFSELDVRGMLVRGESAGEQWTVEVKDSLEVHIHLQRSWVLEAGQYVYFRGHPFYICQWYVETTKGDIETAKDVIVLVVERKSGFTKRLYEKRLDSKLKSTSTLLEGPYGRRLDLWKLGNGTINQATDKYNDVIFFATGIGIVGQLPYINEILLSSRNTRVTMFWEIDRTGSGLHGAQGYG